jgi:hypothetical protein
MSLRFQRFVWQLGPYLEIGHQASGSTHANEKIEIFLKRNNWPITNACENSWIETPTPKIISFRSSFEISAIKHIDALATRLN